MRSVFLHVLYCLVLSLLSLVASPCSGITLNSLDDFQDQTIQNWTSGGMVLTSVLTDDGPAGLGDDALDVDSSNARAVVFNEAQWSGDWADAHIQTIAMDARSSPSNPSDLTLWLGISAGQAPSLGGGGDTYVTASSQTVPNNGLWHHLVFDVAADDWTNAGGSDIAAALTDVFQLRILHNTSQSFIGRFGIAGFQLDNIRVVPESSSITLCLAAVLGCVSSSRSVLRRQI